MGLLYEVSSDWNGKSNFRNKFYLQLDFIWFGGRGTFKLYFAPPLFLYRMCLSEAGWSWLALHKKTLQAEKTGWNGQCPVVVGLRKGVFAGEKQIIFLSKHPRHVIVNCPNIIFLGWRTTRDAQALGINKDQKPSLLCSGHFKLIPQVNLMTTYHANRPPTTISIFIITVSGMLSFSVLTAISFRMSRPDAYPHHNHHLSTMLHRDGIK